MQIDKTQNIQVQGFVDGIAQKEVSIKSTTNAAPDVKVDVNYQDYISKALDCGVTEDAKQIEQARQLLASGALDAPEAALKAAENLLKFGI